MAIQIKTLVLIFFLFAFNLLLGQNKSNVELSGDILEVGIPLTALASTFILSDQHLGKYQFINSMGTSVILTQFLKIVINKTRPNGGKYSFPSGHTSAAFTGAAFLERRYGWKAGIPAYLLASYVGWTRIYTNKHDFWDVIGGAIIGVGVTYLFTKPYYKEKIQLSIVTIDKTNCMNFKMTF